MKKVIFIGIAIALIGVLVWFGKKNSKTVEEFETETAFKTNIVRKSVATGTVIPLEEVEINTQDASALSIENGQKVKLSNKLGEVILKARVSDDIVSGVLYSGKGAWCASSPTGQTVSALLDNQKTDIGEGAAFYDAFVDLSAPFIV